MKKRILTILVTLAVSLSFVLCLGACDLFAKDETICGYWVTETFIIGHGDTTFKGKRTFNLHIYEDGTLTALEESGDYTYVEGTGTWKEEDGAYKFTITYKDKNGLRTENYTGNISKKHLTVELSITPYTYVMVKQTEE